MSNASKSNDWTKPAALAIPKEGYFTVEEGPLRPDLPANARLSRLHDHREDQAGDGSRDPRLRKTHRGHHRGEPACARPFAAPLPAVGALRHRPGQVPSCTRASSIPISTSTPRTRCSCSRQPASIRSSRSSKGFLTDWKTNAPAFIKFVRDHQCPSFLEYGEYPYVSAAEIKKALALKQAFSSMLDHMQ